MEKQTSCRNTRPIFNYLEAHHDGDLRELTGRLHPEIDGLDDPIGFLCDENNWVSTEVVVKLMERAKHALEDDRAAYHIGKFAVKNVSLGYIQKIFVKAFWSSKMGFNHVQKINDKFNRSKRVELTTSERGGTVIRLHWDKSMIVSKDICLYNQAIYTFMPTIWLGKPMKLEETRCYFEGHPYCEYHITWPFQNLIREYLSRFFSSRAMLKDIITEQEKDKEIIEQKYEEVNRLNLELNRRIRQLVAIQDTGKAILSILDLPQLLTVILNILSKVCRLERALIMLVTEDGRYLEYMHSIGFDGGVPEEVKKYRVSMDRVSNIIARVANTGRSEYIPRVKDSKLSRENIILDLGKPSSVYVVPLITRSKVIGVIATDAADGGGVPKEIRDTMEIFSSQIAIAVENARLYSKLNEQMDELKRSHALLSRAERFSFLGNLAARLAHEIKNPMTAIGTFLQLLPQKFDDREFREEFHKVALEETSRVNNLINELLDLVKTRKTHFEFNHIHELVDKMILLVSPESNAKKIEVVRQYSSNICQIWMDSEKIKEVVLNLLSNAVEFTPENGKIEISTKKLPAADGMGNIRIEIRDNGAGIPESMLDKVFDPYFTTKHKSCLHKGTGLGLSIVHKNMQDHSGTVEVKSSLNVGTSFIMTLPLQPRSHFQANEL
ncbi:MAG: GAF domain-containing protein [Deltaproteobacteria bacterium]|nr:GAF domain-containing protein [Deltaproteobacteria bacterium]